MLKRDILICCVLAFLSYYTPYLLLFLFSFVLYLVIRELAYRKTSYYKVTHLSLYSVFSDLGRVGEYYSFKKLKSYESLGGKFLFNVYVPKENGETSEIDVMLICSKGIFVLESKNYSGWIFGKENQRVWCQTLPQERGKSVKEKFYNPIHQNISHIKHLSNYLKIDIPMFSVVVFSERCELKNVLLVNDNVKVIKRTELFPTVSSIYQSENDVLSKDKIEEIYNILYPLSQVDNSVKEKHKTIIKNMLNSESEKDDSIANSKRHQLKSDKFNDSSNSDELSNEISSKVITVNNREENVFKDEINNVKEVENVVNEDNIVSANKLKCPKCGSDLVLRVASKGNNTGKKFYGCSNFPKCRYIKNI